MPNEYEKDPTIYKEYPRELKTLLAQPHLWAGWMIRDERIDFKLNVGELRDSTLVELSKLGEEKGSALLPQLVYSKFLKAGGGSYTRQLDVGLFRKLMSDALAYELPNNLLRGFSDIALSLFGPPLDKYDPELPKLADTREPTQRDQRAERPTILDLSYQIREVADLMSDNEKRLMKFESFFEMMKEWAD